MILVIVVIDETRVGRSSFSNFSNFSNFSR
jgi:hypothetical protein